MEKNCRSKLANTRYFFLLRKIVLYAFFSSLTIKENTGEMFPIRHRYRFQPNVLSRVAYLRYDLCLEFQVTSSYHSRDILFKCSQTDTHGPMPEILDLPSGNLKNVFGQKYIQFPIFMIKKVKRDNERIIKRSRNQRLKMYKMQFYRI